MCHKDTVRHEFTVVATDLTVREEERAVTRIIHIQCFSQVRKPGGNGEESVGKRTRAVSGNKPSKRLETKILRCLIAQPTFAKPC